MTEGSEHPLGGQQHAPAPTYEIVIRRCRPIVVCDASCDEECSLADLGAAIRRIRLDFGIPIEFAPTFRFASGRRTAARRMITTA